MSEQKIVVPEEMLKAAWQAVSGKMKERIEVGDHNGVPELYVARISVETALRWLTENPIVPTGEQMNALTNEVPYQDSGNGRIFHVVIDKWQRRMFLAPEPGIYDALLDSAEKEAPDGADRIDIYTEEGTLLASRKIRGRK